MPSTLHATCPLPDSPALYPVLRLAWRWKLLLAGCMVLPGLAAHASDFVKPTPKELSMTSLPGYPGVPAVILNREELTRGDDHSVQHYERLKILTEEGKKYANVELGYVTMRTNGFNIGDDLVLDSISGRTIHPDGTILPFTGKPYLKVIEKTDGYKVQQKVFTLPDVEVGSIVEYQYFTRISDYLFEAPIWRIQDQLYVKNAHFAWWPTNRTLRDEDQNAINAITWFPILPPGAKVETHELPTSIGSKLPGSVYELRVKDIPPIAKEEYMPPMANYSYRVNFSYSAYRNQNDYWKAVGKHWLKRVNSFMGSEDSVRAAAAQLTAGASTPEQKLRAIYAGVMTVENTEYTREHDKREDKAEGVNEIKNAADVWSQKRGSPTQITELFLALTRAAGFRAYAMWVPDRSKQLFLPAWLDTRQFDAIIAIVNVNGKDEFFDPGSRYCPYGQLAWQHTAIEGLRETDSGTTFALTPIDGFKANYLARVANLTMAPNGEVSGKVDLSFTGAAALRWRQAALRGDDESLRKELREYAENLLPKSLELKISNIANTEAYEQPFKVSYQVQGTIGSALGKRLVLPADFFESNALAAFSDEKRETAVYFHYPRLLQDAVRLNLPPGMTIEAAPAQSKYSLPNRAAYSMNVTTVPTNFTTRRDFGFVDIVVPPKDYTELRGFYSQVEAKDKESVILKVGSANATAQPPSPGAGAIK